MPVAFPGFVFAFPAHFIFRTRVLVEDNVLSRTSVVQMSAVRQLPSQSARFSSFRHCALVLGHPGHELKVFGWIREYKPLVCTITDGSGRSGVSRISSTAALLARLGALPGELLEHFPMLRSTTPILRRDLYFPPSSVFWMNPFGQFDISGGVLPRQQAAQPDKQTQIEGKHARYGGYIRSPLAGI